jgi:hypothetical protein
MAVNVPAWLLEEADRVPLAVDWDLAARAPLAFGCRLIQACRLHPGFRRRGWKPERSRVSWLRPDATEMAEGDWHRTSVLSVLLDDGCLLAVNTGASPVEILLPLVHGVRAWRCICTTASGFVDGASPRAPLDPFTLPPRSIAAYVRDDGTTLAAIS